MKKKIILELDEQGLIEISASLAISATLMNEKLALNNDCGLFYHPIKTIRALLTEIREQSKDKNIENEICGHQNSFLIGKQLFF